jgi:hypothetical protein
VNGEDHVSLILIHTEMGEIVQEIRRFQSFFFLIVTFSEDITPHFALHFPNFSIHLVCQRVGQ